LDQDTIYELIKKYRDNTASESEKQALLEWYRQTAYQDAEFPEDEDAVGEFMLERLNRENKPRNGRIIPIRRWLLAASVLILLGLGSLYVIHIRGGAQKNNIALIPKKDIAPGGNKAILTLANGSKISLTDASNGTVASQNGVQVTKAANGQLVYVIKNTGMPITASGDANSERKAAALAFNTIETPKGGQYQVVLPDGSKVWLNAMSSIKFPVSFSSLKERRVELTGEAYFEVEHNKDLPFRVVSGKQVVEVLGTHFNVNAYPDETGIKTTLLKGSVKVTGDSNSAILKPGQQAEFTSNITISNVNTDEAVAWKNGYFFFDDEKLQDIMRVVARWYDVKVVFADESTQNETFGALSTRFANISTLLNMMEQTGDARFSIDGSTITVSKKSGNKHVTN
jgi:ferric-dicitrate binding protein FerR (iron transport regulator)